MQDEGFCSKIYMGNHAIRGEPVMSARVHIQMMGAFAIEVNGQSYDTLPVRSRKGVSLIQYLIFQRGKPVTTQRLVRELWADRKSDYPEGAMKTMVSRTRALLREVDQELMLCLASGKGTYYWEQRPGIVVDVLELMDTLEEVKKTSEPDEVEALTMRVLSLYRGELYQTGDLSGGVALANWLRREALEAVFRCIDLLKKQEQYNRICEVCRLAANIDDLDEQLHIELMNAMVNLNRASEAMNEYRRITHLNRQVLDMEPSEDMQSYYEELQKAGETLKFNLDVIRNELTERSEERRGPFICDYRAFKEIYNIQMRNLERLGSTMFLAVIMVGNGDDENAVAREAGMAGLMEILRRNLRKGDIVTRFSDSIVAMLLPTVNYDTGGMVMERIEHLFREVYPASTLAFHSRISPLGEPVQHRTKTAV